MAAQQCHRNDTGRAVTRIRRGGPRQTVKGHRHATDALIEHFAACGLGGNQLDNNNSKGHWGTSRYHFGGLKAVKTMLAKSVSKWSWL